MRALWLVFHFETMRQLKRLGYLLVTFGVPIAAVALFLLFRVLGSSAAEAGTGGRGDLPLGANVLGEGAISEDSPLAQARPMGFVDHSGLLGNVPTLIRFSSEEAALNALKNGEISAYYVIAADYLQTGKVEAYFQRFNLGSLSDVAIRQALLSALIRQADLAPQKLALLQARTLDVTPIAIGEVASQATENTNLLLANVFAILLLFTALTTSGYLLQSLTEERENRAAEVLLSALRPRDLLFGKFLAMNVLALLQTTLWIGTALFLLSQAAGILPDLSGIALRADQVIVLVVYFVLGYLFFSSVYAIISALTANFREGTQLSVVVILPAMLPFYLSVAFINTPNEALPVLLSMIPITAPLAMTLRASVTSVPLGEVLLSAALLSLTIVACVWLAARLFRVNMLLSGRPPKLRDVLRLVSERA
ncbi:MAG: ABC transporter permease [Anaerolineae bacterium]|nr:ABC transporter permease [Anaerolineae bacterium]